MRFRPVEVLMEAATIPKPLAPPSSRFLELTPLLALADLVRGTGSLVLAKAECLSRSGRLATPEQVGAEILLQWPGSLDAIVCGLDRPWWLERLAWSLGVKRPWMQVVGVRLEGPGTEGPVPDVVTRVVVVPPWEAQRAADRLLEVEGLSVGTRAGANVLAAHATAGQIGPRAVVITILPDRGDLAASAPAAAW